MRSAGLWLPMPGSGSDVRLAAWLTRPEATPNGAGVVVIPPYGYERSSGYHFWRILAERLAASGCQCLRVDPFGTGDSAGLDIELRNLATVAAAADAGVRRLRAGGCDRIALVGGQLGATAALLEAQHWDDIAAVVAVTPVLSGGRFVRQLKLLGREFPDGGGALAVAGTVYSPDLLDDIASVDLTSVDVRRPVLLTLTKQSRSESAFAAAQTGPVDVAIEESLYDVFERPAEEAVVDPATIERIAGWILDAVGGAAVTRRPADAATVRKEPADPITARLPWRDSAVTERFVTVGPDELAGVLTTAPAAGDGDEHEIVVFLNTGSDPHAGPSRAWVEFARDLAVRGRRATLRVDWRGWGETPGPSAEPGRPYDDSSIHDTRRLVAWLHEQGWPRVVLAGLCASSWVALHVARDTPVEGVLALNPQMYWQPGWPVVALMTTAREIRMDEILAIKADAAAGRWDDEDERGVLPPAGHWLNDLAASGARIWMLFAEGDDGIEYLTDRLGRRLAAACASGRVSVAEVPDVDHGMHMAWRRPAVLAAMAAALDEEPVATT